MDNNGRESRSFHQGVNAAAFFGLCALAYNDVISSGMFVVLMIAMIAIYSFRYK